MASFKELNNIKNLLNKQKSRFIFLKCTAAYPASAKSFNLNTLADMEKKFKCIVGLSDHSLGSAVASSSVALGARVIEKHLTISRKDKAIDSFFSSDENNFKNFVQDVRLSFEALGKIFMDQRNTSVLLCKKEGLFMSLKISKKVSYLPKIIFLSSGLLTD